MLRNRKYVRRPGLATGLLAFALSVGAQLASPSVGRCQGVYFTRDDVLRSFFGGSERVAAETVNTAEAAPNLERSLGYRPARASYVVYVATTGGNVDGYAVIDDEDGQHLPITLATHVDPDGALRRTEVMVYREAHGSEIRSRRFREQLQGKTEHDPMALGDDVAAVSGATISSRSVVRAAKRALALVAVVRARHAKPLPSSAQAPAPTARP